MMKKKLNKLVIYYIVYYHNKYNINIFYNLAEDREKIKL